MAFSLFGKKDAPPTKKKTTTGAIENPGGQAQESAGRQEAAPTSGDADLSLDFSHYAPPPPAAKSTPPEPPRQPAAAAQKPAAAPQAPTQKQAAAAPVPQAPSQKPDAVAPVPRASVSKSGARAAASAAPKAVGAPAPGASSGASAGAKAAATLPVAKPVAAPPATQEKPSAPASVSVPSVQEPPPDSIMSIEVTSSAADTAPVIEEAAILFANGQSLQALTALAVAVHEGNLGSSALQAWLMLFDLYRSLSMRDEFEALGMEFLAKFERSPPVWIEAEPQFNAALATGGIGYCALTGVLSDESASQLEQLSRMSQRQQAIRIDFAKLQGVDPFGCARLLAVFEVLRTSGKDAVFTGEAHLLRLLEAECRMEDKDTDGVLWSLLFEILRRLGMKDRFEETAVNYAVTYELSPPSWESQAAAKPRPSPSPSPNVAATEPAQPAFHLSGDVTGANESLPEKLRDWAKSNSPLVIDMSAVRRVDFVSAGQLLNVFTKLHQAGATIQIRGANELVAALFEVMGIGQVARIIRNR